MVATRPGNTGISEGGRVTVFCWNIAMSTDRQQVAIDISALLDRGQDRVAVNCPLSMSLVTLHNNMGQNLIET